MAQSSAKHITGAKSLLSNIYTVASGNLVLRIDTSVTPVTVDKIFGLVGRDHSVYKVPLCNLQILRKILFLHNNMSLQVTGYLFTFGFRWGNVSKAF